MSKLGNAVRSVVLKSKTLQKISPKVGAAVLTAKNVSPDVYLFLGIAAGVAAGVMVVKAAKRHDEEIIDTELELSVAKSKLNDAAEVTPKERAQVLAPIYGKYAGTLIRLYGPSVAMGATSIYFIMTSHGIVKGRNKALLATVQLLEHGYSQYRERVRKEYGAEVEEALYSGAETRKVNTVDIDETGKKTKGQRQDQVIPEEYHPDMYKRLFDAVSPEFSPDRDLNLYYLRANQKYNNDILQINGWLLLNDVYRSLGMSRTAAGAVVGWVLDGDGDGYIDYGLDKPVNQNAGDNRFVLDFNVDGVILDSIG